MISEFAKLVKNKKINTIISSKVLSRNNLSEIFIKFFEKKTNKFFLNFIRIIAMNERLLILPKISMQFEKLYKKQKKIIEIEITTARYLEKKQKFKLLKLIKNSFSENLKINYQIDHNIIAGIILKKDNKVIDCSMRHYLLTLKNFLSL